VLPVNFQDEQVVDRSTVAVQVKTGQRVIARVEIEWQPPGTQNTSFSSALVKIGYRVAGSTGPLTTELDLPIVGLQGSYLRRETIQRVLDDLPAGTYEIGLAGLGFNADDEYITVHAIRWTIIAVEP
jgi:hypothetical protein